MDAALFRRWLQGFTQRYQLTAIKLIEGGRMWDGTPGMLHVLGDTFAQPCQRLAILEGHAPAGMGWDDFIEVNSQFKGELAYGRSSQHTFLRRCRNFRRCKRG